MNRTCLRRALPICAAALALAALTQSVAAQMSAAQQDALRSSCRSDFMSHCSGVTPGGKEALGCLEKNVAQLSPACQAAVRAIAPRAPATARTAPAVSAPPVTLTPPPATAVAPNATKTPLVNAVVMLRACKLDLIRHCQGIQPGGGRELACLAAHQGSLTFRCRTALKVTRRTR